MSAEAIMETVEGICLAGSKGLTLEEAAQYINRTKEYARRCINVTIQLGMIRKINEKYIAKAESEDISRAMVNPV